MLSRCLVFGLGATAAVVVQAISGIQTNPSRLNGLSFDYVIIGAGLAGLTVANRLSHNSSVSVLVIEAGLDDRELSWVYDVYEYGVAFDTNLDWAWPSSHGRVIRGGRTLGGSTCINGLAWTRGQKNQYDVIGQKFLGGTKTALANGWSWDGMLVAMMKAEALSPPNDNQRAKGASSQPVFHGATGPVQVTYADLMFGGPQQPAFYDTVSTKFSIPASADADGGDAAVVAYHPDSMSWPGGDQRSSSATAYWSPIEGHRHNIAVLVGQMATKINFASGKTPFTATSVNFSPTTKRGFSYTVHARLEVILAAGAIQSPKLLQLSGIGDPALLKRVGVNVTLNLPGVGKNLQEQTMNSIGWDTNGFDRDGRGPSDCIAYPNFDALFTSNASYIRNLLNSSIPGYAQDAYNAGGVVSVQAAKEIFAIQQDLLVNGGVGVVEYFLDTGFPNGGLGIDMWQLLPFSRGTVEINSTDPYIYPIIDPRYFAASFDMETQIAGARQSRKIFETLPLRGLVVEENAPGFGTVPNDANGGSWEAWHKWIVQGFASVHHPIATCAMMRYELGGVVDENLRIYNTTNVRVVDASVLPMQVSAHLASTLYGVAELAAQIIKAGK